MVSQLDPDSTALSGSPCRIDCSELDREWPVQSNLGQAALHDLLRRLDSLGLPLISVNRVESGQTDASDVRQ